MSKHISVLLEETIHGLNIKEDGKYVDATLGYGGHSSEILKRVKRGYLFALDQDKQAIAYSDQRLAEISDNYEIIHTNFSNIKHVLNERGIEQVDGICFDLGVSSPQLDDLERGFSYHANAKLDMRMDQTQELTAYDVVNTYELEQLTKIFRDYGEEKYAYSIAKNIVARRLNSPITTTEELVTIIKASMPMKAMEHKHPAKKVFQAIRIEVNGELAILKASLIDAIALLKPGGRIAVIAFHSLEDRIVKTLFRELSEIDAKVKGLPVIPKEYMPTITLIDRHKPTGIEIENNNRSRSAVLRVAEKI